MGQGQQVRGVRDGDTVGAVTRQAEWSRVIERGGRVVGSICMSRFYPVDGSPPGVWIYDISCEGDDTHDAAVLMAAARRQAKEWGLANNVRANVTNMKLLAKAIGRGFSIDAYIIKGEL